MEPKPYSDERHEKELKLSEREADLLTQTRNAVMTAACKQTGEPHGLFMVNMEPYRLANGDVGITSSMTLHGCSGCLIECIAGSLGQRLSLSDLSRLLLLLSNHLAVRAVKEGPLKMDLVPRMVH